MRNGLNETNELFSYSPPETLEDPDVLLSSLAAASVGVWVCLYSMKAADYSKNHTIGFLSQ